MGVTKEILAEGNGPTPTKGASVTVHCTGYGKGRDLQQKFWSTKDPGQTPFTFKVGLGQVIKGWDEGVLGMKLGESARLTCTPDYAYGAGGFPAWGYPFHQLVAWMYHLGFCSVSLGSLTVIFVLESVQFSRTRRSFSRSKCSRSSSRHHVTLSTYFQASRMQMRRNNDIRVFQQWKTCSPES